MSRVTQSMLSGNMLRNLNNSYGKISKMQDNLTTGMKISRPSDDPVVAIKGMNYRTQLDKIGQFQRNMNEVNGWLDTTDSALDQVGSTLNRVKELVVQAANDTNTPDDRAKIKLEIDQIRQQMHDVANTQLNGKYIFSGTKTHEPAFKEGVPNTDTNEEEIKIEVFDGIQLTVNTHGAQELFTTVDSILGNVSNILGDETLGGKEVGDLLGSIADGSNTTLADAQALVLNARADVGARQNRVELMMNRLDIQEINVTKQKSNNEDVDYAKTITNMTTQESIHQAALSVGAKIIQQTLVDFMR